MKSQAKGSAAVGYPLCQTFVQLASRTWNRLELGSSYGISQNEETITENNLLDLKARHPQKVKIRTFTKHEEAKNGADWEWWIGAPDGWVGMRLQAKKLKAQGYPNLDKSNNYGLQVDSLIRESRKDGLRPLYCFYNSWNSSKIQVPWNCRNFPPVPQLLGCGMAPAPSIKSLVNQGQKKLTDVAPHMFPWSCIVCCPGPAAKSASLATRANQFLNEHFRDEGGPTNELRARPPTYVPRSVESEGQMEATGPVKNLLVLTEGL